MKIFYFLFSGLPVEIQWGQPGLFCMDGVFFCYSAFENEAGCVGRCNRVCRLMQPCVSVDATVCVGRCSLLCFWGTLMMPD